ncbi:NAD-dependent epimerase/dehydratase family protein [Devosia beringensis]|uniref:NAD-dependent epimerase/dehydratase family protein n=1 Tax=Devosia beringensis TaxID=2657486 RepID=UPI00186BB117|nr:SDR family oxidoreductase [Devosia beringensis]
MRILIAGNMGYVGPIVVRHLRKTHPDYVIDGFDTAFFAHCLTGVSQVPERNLDNQFFGDVRDMLPEMLQGYDAVVELAAISNDPMGNRYAEVTEAINQKATMSIAQAAAKTGVSNFVFASSCSVYGVAVGPARKENDPLNPVTAYAKSKVGTEIELEALDTDMTITSLRFATACGMSDRLRLDLVLNDFVACAISQKRITVLSDGTPWRPLIDVADMALAIDWAIHRKPANGGRNLVVNAGSDDRNYQVRDLAQAVAAAVPGTEVSIDTTAPADSRSYKVDFGKYALLAPDHQPRVTLAQSIEQLVAGLDRMQFADADFRNSQLIRLKVLERHIGSGALSERLLWT